MLFEPTDAQREEIAAGARELDRLRNNWLNPPEWTRVEILEFPGTVGGPWDRYIDPVSRDPQGSADAPDRPSAPRQVAAKPGEIGTVRYPRVVPRDAECARLLKKRTLTNLYNERPTWLDLAHRRLDEAVFAAYGWDPVMSDEDLLAALLELNLGRSGG